MIDPNDPEVQRAVRELYAEVSEQMDRMAREDASGWMVVCIDLEPPPSPTLTFGPFVTPEAALIEAAKHAEESKRFHDPGEHGWKYEVVPNWPPAFEKDS
jgi:hypothetical protein